MREIIIARDFSDTPGARYESEGPNSGEKFRDEVLIPEYNRAIQENSKLRVNLDGCYGFATSFLEESFGGMVRKFKRKGILDDIDIVSYDDLTSKKLIMDYVKAEEKKL